MGMIEGSPYGCCVPYSYTSKLLLPNEVTVVGGAPPNREFTDE
jgi:hypothetical protein